MDTIQQHNEKDDDEDINPIRILLPDNQLKSNFQNIPTLLQDQSYYIPSINSSIVIRQLPSQGLSFQLWPAASTLFSLLSGHRSNPASNPLSKILAHLSSTTKLKVLELGSGTGLVGITAAVTLGASVTVTDLPHVVPNLQFNVEANADVVALGGGTVKAAALRWGREGDGDIECLGKDFDVILGSDVVYYDYLYEPLLYTLRLVMGGGKDVVEEKRKVFVLGHLRRWKKDSVFFKRAKKLFDVHVIYVDAPFEGSRTGVVVYCFSQKGSKFDL